VSGRDDGTEEPLAGAHRYGRLVIVPKTASASQAAGTESHRPPLGAPVVTLSARSAVPPAAAIHRG